MKEEQSKKKRKDNSEGKKSRSRKIWISLVIAIMVVILGVAGGTVAGIYYYRWSNAYTSSFLSVIDLPVVSVGKTRISLSKFNKALSSLEKYQTLEASLGEKEGADPSAQISPKELRLNLLGRMIDDVVVTDLLEAHNVSVSEEDVESELTRLDDVLGEDINVEDHVREIYNWSLDEFKEFALRPGLQEFKLNQTFAADESIGGDLRLAEKEAQSKAQSIVDEIRGGADFGEKAKEFSEDSFTVEEGGDLGFISRGEMVPAFEEVAFSLEKGEVSDPVKSQFGYHIITVEEIEGDGKEEKRKIRHILFLLDDQFTNWFLEEKKKLNVTVYDQRFKWNAEEGKAENK